MAAAGTDTEWVSEVLVRGGYTGSTDAVLQVCQAELNDGASDVVSVVGQTPLGKLADAARTAQLRPTRQPAASTGAARTRHRGTKRTLVADVVSGTLQLQSRPAPDAPATAWVTRLAQICKLWGDGWVLRQAVALVPDAATSNLMNVEPLLTRLLQREREARGHRGNADWWRSLWRAADSGLEQRAWLFSVLTVAHTQVVLALAAEINEAAAGLSPRNFRAMERALEVFGQSSLGRRLVLRDGLRISQVLYSGRALWLLRLVSTEGSQEQIDRRLGNSFEELLAAGMGDRRELLQIVGRSRAVKVNSLKGTRELLASRSWAGEIRLGTLNATTAADVLKHPEDWPVEVVGRAIQHVATQLRRLPSVGQLAEENRWFERVDES